MRKIDPVSRNWSLATKTLLGQQDGSYQHETSPALSFLSTTATGQEVGIFFTAPINSFCQMLSMPTSVLTLSHPNPVSKQAGDFGLPVENSYEGYYANNCSSSTQQPAPTGHSLQ